MTDVKIHKRANNNESSSKKRAKLKRFIPIYIMMLPGLVYLFINNYMPLPGLIVAFKQYNAKLGIYGSKFIGFKNFEYLFKTTDAWVITRNTILYNIAFIIVNTVMAIMVAVILSELNGKRKKAYQSLILLPNLISTVIIGYLVFAFLSVENGFANNTILPLFGKEPIDWYSEPRYWPFIIIFVSAWKSVGYNCIVYLATIMGFDRSYYESALVDGATRWKQFQYITLPLLKPTIIMLTLMAVGRIFYSDFGLFYQVPMNQGALYSVTNTIDTYVYRGLLQLGNISMSAAAGLYQSIVGFILVLSANMLVRRLDKDSALIQGGN
ncbi:putative aldouronate transport system permease protein [Anaerobium acetethylicum]|uniref:Putative aldouronate transport system permease protein n=2 Tax=Anaerobium acetethylicum TaxID=1619234 RepID=A0A1D3TSV3_9FIRM|nr:ABC transporter permease subunit [Anaerobium acetethylicum]SCP96983.1 putative aldouronate transport system permease protein [Anaerobium acetethylicum]